MWSSSEFMGESAKVHSKKYNKQKKILWPQFQREYLTTLPPFSASRAVSAVTCQSQAWRVMQPCDPMKQAQGSLHKGIRNANNNSKGSKIRDPKRTTATPFWRWVPGQKHLWHQQYNKRSRNTPTKKRLRSKCWNLSANMGRMGMGFLDYASPSYLFRCRAMINVFLSHLSLSSCHFHLLTPSYHDIPPLVSTVSGWIRANLFQARVTKVTGGPCMMHQVCSSTSALGLLLKGATFWNCTRGYQSSGLAKVNINHRMRACQEDAPGWRE